MIRIENINKHKIEKIPGITFAKAICALGIILFHYAFYTKSSYKILYSTVNGSFGSIFVSVFFAISGILLYRNYPQISNLKTYFYKRWKSIFPPFYLCFAYFFLQSAIRKGKFFYGPEPIRLLLSLFGLDGYLAYRIPNYYLVGEWFLGAIILLYVLYPILLWITKKIGWQWTLVILIGGWYLALSSGYFHISAFRNLLTCCISFYTGIVFEIHHNKIFKNPVLCVIAITVFVLCAVIPIDKSNVFVSIVLIWLQGYSMLIVFVYLGNYIMVYRIRFIFQSIGNLSFCIFLFQHRVINDLQTINNPTGLKDEIIMICFTVLLTVICAKVLSIITEAVTKSKLFQRIEKKILSASADQKTNLGKKNMKFIKEQTLFQNLKKHQFLFEELVKRDFKKKYKRTVLGMAWSVLSPLFMLLVMRLVFTQFFGRNTPHYTTYLFCGNLCFSFFSESTTQGMTSLLSNAGIFSKVNVPKYLFLLSKNVQCLVNFGLTLCVFFFFCILDHITFTWKFVFLLYPICCQVLFNIGIGMILSALFVFFRDTQYLWTIFAQFLMYMSAIFYKIDSYSAKVQNLFLLNPVYLFIRYFRKIVIEATIPAPQFHLLMLADVIIAVGIGCWMYKKYNTRFLYYV